MSGFMAFLTKTNALALAIAVIIGIALGNVVNSLVNDIIMPPVGLLLGKVDFSQLKWVLQSASGSQKEVAISYGAFINVCITFVIVALVVYLIVQTFVRPAPQEPTPEMKTCPFCKDMVPADATKCRSCTSALEA